MDYIPVHEGEDDGSTVTVSPGKLQRTGVRAEPVERRVLATPVRAPGVLDEDERRISVVAVRTEAFIEKVENVTTGDHVHKGQPLLRLYSPRSPPPRPTYLSAVGFEGARRRLENLAVRPNVIDEIERTRKVPLTITWTAPRDGVVIERSVSDGMRAMPGDCCSASSTTRSSGYWPTCPSGTCRRLPRDNPPPCGSAASPAARSRGPSRGSIRICRWRHGPPGSASSWPIRTAPCVRPSTPTWSSRQGLRHPSWRCRTAP